MMDYEAKRLLKGRRVTLMIFEAVYKALGASVVIPFCLWLINTSMKAVGVSYITPGNIGYLFNPAVVISAIASAIIMSVYTLIELASIITCFEYARYDKIIGVRKLLIEGVKRSFKAVKPRNWGIIVFAILIVPVGGLLLSSGFLGELSLPEYIAEVIDANTLYSVGLTIITIAASLISLRWLFVFHVFFLEDKSMVQAAKDSARMMKGRYVKTVVSYIWWIFKVALKLFGVCAVIIAIGAALLYIFASSDGIYAILMGVVDISQTLMGYVVSIVMLVSNYSWISSRYYAIKGAFGELDEDKILVDGKSHTRFMTAVAVVVSAAFMVVSAMSAYWIIKEGYLFDDMDVSGIRVVAHRGCGNEAPENTLPAYIEAIEQNADYGELDVHWTKDKKVVLSHDDNLIRTGGVDVNIWDITYDELMKIDRGSTFSEEFAGLRYSTLEEIMTACKNKLNLIIEIKMDNHDVGIEKDVVELVNEYGYENNCYVASLSYDCIKRVKECDSGIKTMYFAPFALGDVEQLEYADAIGIEMTFLSESIVDSLHSASKPVFVWTVDDSDHIKKCVDLDVDYIISNDPANTRYVIRENENEVFRALIELRGMFIELAESFNNDD